MNIKEYQDAQRPEEVRQKKYEEACAQVLPGYLSSHDLCRLLSNLPYSTWSSHPGQTAKALVESLALPIMEILPGKWVVAHTLTGLEVPHE